MHVSGMDERVSLDFLREIRGCVCVCAARLVFHWRPHPTLADCFPFLPHLSN